MPSPSFNTAGLTHGALFRRYKLTITGTFALLALENILSVLEPYILGRAIDGLIGQSYQGLFLFLALASLGLVIGILRRIYDTRVYGRIYCESACKTVERENARAAPITQVSARANFVHEFTSFFEIYLPAALMSFFTLAGSIIMLGVISFRLFTATLIVTILAAAVFYFSRKRIGFLNRMLNDEMERQVDVLTARQKERTHTHFSSIVRWGVSLSDLEARNFGLVFLLTIILTAIAVYIMIALEDRSEGQVFAALTYILQFSQAVIMLPYTYQQYLRTSEISQRLSADPGAAESIP